MLSLETDSYILMWVLSFSILLDIFSGLIKSCYLGDKDGERVDSRRFFKGILKKVSVYAVIAAANILGFLLNHSIPIMNAVIILYIVNELISIVENVGMVMPIPDILKKRLEVMRNKINTETKSDKDDVSI